MTEKTKEFIPFNRIEGAYVILSDKGIYRPADIYELNQSLYAKIRNGWIALKAANSTSSPNTRWVLIEGVEFVIEYNGLKTKLEQHPAKSTMKVVSRGSRVARKRKVA